MFLITFCTLFVLSIGLLVFCVIGRNRTRAHCFKKKQQLKKNQKDDDEVLADRHNETDMASDNSFVYVINASGSSMCGSRRNECKSHGVKNECEFASCGGHGLVATDTGPSDGD